MLKINKSIRIVKKVMLTQSQYSLNSSYLAKKMIDFYQFLSFFRKKTPDSVGGMNCGQPFCFT